MLRKPQNYHCSYPDTMEIMPLLPLLIALFSVALTNLSDSVEWRCLDGYRRADDNLTCVDIDECFENGLGTCGQTCTNMPGSYTCSCLPGYTLQDNKWSCHPDSPSPYLIFSHGNAIFKIDIEGPNHQKLVTNSGISVLLDFHYRNGRIYWVSMEKGLIQRAFINGTKRENVRAVGKGLLGFAVDWLHNTIIWTNQRKGTIEMSNLNGKNSKILLKELTFPTVVAVDPEEGYMFWASEGSVPSVQRATLKGTGVVTIFKTVNKVKSLSLDLIDKRLFWVQSDAGNVSSSIGSCDYNGDSPYIIKQSMHHQPFGISAFAEYIYYSDWNTSAIRRVDKYTGKDIVTISLKPSFLPPADVKVVHPFRQPAAEPGSQSPERNNGNICKKDPEERCECKDGFVLSDDQNSCEDVNECAFWNHGCTLGCENFPGSYRCYCPEGFVLLPDMKTCHDPVPCLENYTECSHDCIQTSKGPICVCPPGSILGSDGKTCSGCTVPDNGGCGHICVLQNPVSWKCECLPGYQLQLDRLHCIASGPRPFLLFANSQDIRRINFDGTDYHIVLERQMGGVFALDYDPVQKKIYFAHTGLKWIERAKLDGSEREELISNDLDLPEGLAVDWINRKLYWTDRGLSHIGRSELNGMHREVIINEGIDTPRGIVVHPLAKRLFWTDWGDKPRIETSSLDGDGRLVIVSTNLMWPSGIAIDYLTDKLYWCDTKQSVIEMSDLDGSNRRILAQNEVGRPFGVAVFEDHVWFTDWSKPSLMRVDKSTGHNRVRLRGGMIRPSSLAVVHPIAKPGADPCLYKNGGCDQICENRFGIPHCLCRDGFQKTTDGKSCQAVNLPPTAASRKTLSLEVNVLMATTSQKKEVSPTQLSSSVTNFNEDEITADLQPRSTLVAEIMVSDQDDCGRLECDLNAQCVAPEGIGRCQCLQGFTGNGTVCCDVDECATDASLCNRHLADCINTEGGYVCKCHPGYSGDGLLCYDIDECKTGTHNCDENAVCTNTDGNYICTCNKGFWGTGYSCKGVIGSALPTDDSMEITVRSTTFETTTHKQNNHIATCPLSHQDFCLNGGVCFHISEITMFACNCLKGYMGERCEYSDLQWWELHRVEEEKRRNVLIAICVVVLICLLSVGACVTHCYRHQKHLKKSQYSEEMSDTSSSSINNVTDTSTNNEQQNMHPLHFAMKLLDIS
ncbi:pro-epidermal growth factor isoform X2 [Stegostoma tigrinum]|uniref:pro-epidermal growth factor isoform X2 n=1 Tax=Stegostoma tigrinum TaxID=3053191 RepID=UPI00202AF061|nr:pro-epidermal growth factor isoform X2 [Stegostoma tigrinum]